MQTPSEKVARSISIALWLITFVAVSGILVANGLARSVTPIYHAAVEHWLAGQPLYYDKDGNPDLDDKSGGVEYFTISPIADLPVPVIDNQPNNTTAIDKLKNYEPEDDVQHDLPF